MPATRTFGGIVSDPSTDTRVRRALDRFRINVFWVTGEGVTINDRGQIALIANIVSSVAVPTTALFAKQTRYIYFVSGTTTLTLPTAVGNTSFYTVKNSGSNTVTIATTSSQTIDGSTPITLPVANTSLDIVSDGANWRIV